MLSICGLHLTFSRFFCKIKEYKGKFCCAVLVACLLLPLCSGCRRKEATPTPPPSPSPVDHSAMRGVWLSYIELDGWLSDGDPATIKAQLDKAMGTCRQAGLNTVFFHVRAHGDAYYPSAVWPTATAATAVVAQGIDPLAYAIDAAHKQGLRLHAWINPYRLSGPVEGVTSFQKAGTWYLAPSDPAARQTVLDGVREILTRYEVDGIHFDDYFYPAGMAKTGETFETVPAGTDVTAWRQAQVDTLISGVYSLCRQHRRPFGVSPAADRERNRTVAYANVDRWMQEAGYIDYICPQIYTGFRHQTKPFSSLLEEWVALPRRQEVALYIGLALYKVGLENDPYAGSGAAEWVEDTHIIQRQISQVESAADGYVLFRYGNLNQS